jgi:exodeoxyribonuclease III
MNKIKFLSWNVNGVRAALKKGALEALDTIGADIVCLQEIKAKAEQIPEELMGWSGYQPYVCAAERPGYSGVAVFVKTPPERVAYGIGDERFDREGRTLVLDYPQFRLVNCYFPNGGNGPERLKFKMDFYAAFQRFAEDSPKPLVVCGDVNTAHREIDLARPKENVNNTGFLPMERAWIDEFLTVGFSDTFRLFHEGGGYYTWWDMKTRARERDIGWRIDYFFVSRDLETRVADAYILPEVMGSDHCPVILELDL